MTVPVLLLITDSGYYLFWIIFLFVFLFYLKYVSVWSKIKIIIKEYITKIKTTIKIKLFNFFRLLYALQDTYVIFCFKVYFTSSQNYIKILMFIDLKELKSCAQNFISELFFQHLFIIFLSLKSILPVFALNILNWLLFL